MSRDSYGATEPNALLDALAKTSGREYSVVAGFRGNVQRRPSLRRSITVAALMPLRRNTSYTSYHCRTDTDRCDPLCPRGPPAAPERRRRWRGGFRRVVAGVCVPGRACNRPFARDAARLGVLPPPP